MWFTDPSPQGGRGQTPRTTTLEKVLEMQYHPALGRMQQQTGKTELHRMGTRQVPGRTALKNMGNTSTPASRVPLLFCKN